MTGFGKAEITTAERKITIETRSLNGKQLDLSVKMPARYRQFEYEVRNKVAKELQRGKVDLSIYYQDAAQGETTATFAPINREAFAYYYKELTELQTQLGINNTQDLLATIMRMPDVTRLQDSTDVNEEEWTLVLQTLNEAIAQFNAFRQQEGLSLYQMFCDKLEAIADLLTQVQTYEQGRVEKIKARIEANLEQLSATTQQAIDRNRLEQEMIYYLEKLDITEEKVRLTNHLRYFRETMDGEGAGVGKKLGFIAQEMGREINTLGSKSNQSEMQIIVVKMKDILEQIKEQVLNVL